MWDELIVPHIRIILCIERNVSPAQYFFFNSILMIRVFMTYLHAKECILVDDLKEIMILAR